MTRLVDPTRLCRIALCSIVLTGAFSCSEDETPVPESGDSGSDSAPDGTDGAGGGRRDGGDAEAAPSACDLVMPDDSMPLIDDFEDNDHQIVVIPHRDGFWTLSDDGTAGAARTPPGSFKPESGGRAGSRYAAHFTASGFTAWGASLATGLVYQDEALFCAYNASKFAGISFWAKGPGTIRVNVASAATVPSVDNGGLLGGACVEPSICWDFHGKNLVLSNDWAYYEVGWKSLEQFGFGTGTLGDLDPSKVAGLTFSVLAGAEFQPADFWVDDVTFVKTLTGGDGGGTEAGAGDADSGGDTGATREEGGDVNVTQSDAGDASVTGEAGGEASVTGEAGDDASATGEAGADASVSSEAGGD